MYDEFEMQEPGDSTADAIAAVALIAIFVATCIFWISGQWRDNDQPRRRLVVFPLRRALKARV